MQVVFFATGFDRPMPYAPLQLVGALASTVSAWALLRPEPAALVGGFGVNLAVRVLTLALGLTRLAWWANVFILLAFALATSESIRWTLSPHKPRDAGVRTACALLGLGYFVAVLLSLGRLSAAAALTLGAAGFWLAAANVEASASPGARADRSD